ncbi:glycosyltransferase [Chroococcidiopsis sp.]|uniref:glycosyltransferase n=1 Tax=Chroococcidiopsis sp. TaxID=3088168 RepID=UPI003F328E42
MTFTDRRPIRILQVVGGMVRGGIETWLMNVLRHIDRDRFQIDFLVHTDRPCDYDDEVRALGSKIIPCLHPSKPWLFARNFRQILQDYGPYDVVHSQLYLFSGFILRLAAQEKVPIRISHVHPLTDIKGRSFLRSIYRQIMTRWTSKYATHIIAPSKTSLEAFQAICDCSHQQTYILYNGVEIDRFEKNIDKVSVRQKLSLPIETPIIIYVARFAPHKNHLQMIRVAEQINQGKIQAHFVMAGSTGEHLTMLRERVERRQDISIITGLNDVSHLLMASDLFFFPSLEEGFGVVAIEAAAASLPIVATNLLTIREACPPSHHAFMFSPNDDAAACANILKILNDKELKMKLSDDAKQWSNNFPISKSVDSLVNIYAHLGKSFTFQ